MIKRKHKKSAVTSQVDPGAIGRRIRQIRGFELTQAEFGEILGIGQAQLSKYELGLSLPTAEVLARLREYSGKTIDWIITGEEDPASK